MRVFDWPVRLFATLARHEALIFSYGTSDCMQLAMDCAEAVSGMHPYPDAKGREAYHDRRGAKACLKRHGFANIVEALSARYPLVAPALAQRGDLGIVMMDEVPCAVVCEGLQFAGKPPATLGLTRVGRDRVVQAFRVT